MSSKIKRFYRDSKVAVLYSPGFGAGWSTFNDHKREFALFDPTLVKMAEGGADDMDVAQYVGQVFRGEEFCTNGWEDICIAWLDPGQQFIVKEYDGHESIVFPDDIEWNTA